MDQNIGPDLPTTRFLFKAIYAFIVFIFETLRRKQKIKKTTHAFVLNSVIIPERLRLRRAYVCTELVTALDPGIVRF